MRNISHAKVERVRGRALQRIRARWFHHHPLCVLCAERGRVAEATELDHIVRLEDGGSDDASNRQGLCHDCHLTKTLREKGYDERQPIGADGWPVEKAVQQ
jgi:5-methylcytosine-specific restriction enzyme A